QSPETCFQTHASRIEISHLNPRTAANSVRSGLFIARATNGEHLLLLPGGEERMVNRAGGPSHLPSVPFRRAPVAPRRSISAVEFACPLSRSPRHQLQPRFSLPVRRAPADQEVLDSALEIAFERRVTTTARNKNCFMRC